MAMILKPLHFWTVAQKIWTGTKHCATIEEGILKAKTECYAKDKVKSPRFSDHFTMISCHFFANYMIIFHKTEVQTVILRCLTGLKLNWLKSYDTKCKHFHFHFFSVLLKTNSFSFFVLLVFCVFCVITLHPIEI